VWGARTLAGTVGRSTDLGFVPVRRMASFIEDSVCRGTRWCVFEPNGERLWAQLRRVVGDFLDGLFRQGAFVGTKAEHAWTVRCDFGTHTAADMAAGHALLHIGFAPMRPAEFVMLKLRLRTAG
jgi:hypothetical protein